MAMCPTPRTILEGIHKLPPAHYAVWHDGALTIERYWSPDWNLERERPLEEDIEELRATLDDAVREQMIADVPSAHSCRGALIRRLSSGSCNGHRAGR